MIDVHCFECGHEMAVGEEYAGQTGKCPKCGGTVHVPKATADSEPVGGVSTRWLVAIFCAGLACGLAFMLFRDKTSHKQSSTPEALATQQTQGADNAYIAISEAALEVADARARLPYRFLLKEENNGLFGRIVDVHILVDPEGKTKEDVIQIMKNVMKTEVQPRNPNGSPRMEAGGVTVYSSYDKFNGRELDDWPYYAAGVYKAAWDDPSDSNYGQNPHYGVNPWPPGE